MTMAAIATVRQVTTPSQTTASLSANGAGFWGGVWGMLGATSRSRISPLEADNQLVERCLAGQEEAWEDLVTIHTRRVYGICYRFTSSTHAAQDLTQEV